MRTDQLPVVVIKSLDDNYWMRMLDRVVSPTSAESLVMDFGTVHAGVSVPAGVSSWRLHVEAVCKQKSGLKLRSKAYNYFLGEEVLTKNWVVSCKEKSPEALQARAFKFYYIYDLSQTPTRSLTCLLSLSLSHCA